MTKISWTLKRKNKKEIVKEGNYARLGAQNMAFRCNFLVIFQNQKRKK